MQKMVIWGTFGKKIDKFIQVLIIDLPINCFPSVIPSADSLDSPVLVVIFDHKNRGYPIELEPTYVLNRKVSYKKAGWLSVLISFSERTRILVKETVH
jgi:hypothetical protein